MKLTLSIPAIIATFLLGAVLALPGPVPVAEPESDIAARQGVVTIPGKCTSGTQRCYITVRGQRTDYPCNEGRCTGNYEDGSCEVQIGGGAVITTCR